MDDQRFDDLARSVASGFDPLRRRLTRRSLWAGVAAATVGLALGRSDETAAACPRDQVQRRGQGCVCKATGRPPDANGICPCLRGLTWCGAACVDLRTDASHCGACGATCAAGPDVAGLACHQGACRVTSCAPGLANCDADLVCETTLGTDADCAACGDVCLAGQTCQGGACVCTAANCPDGCCDANGQCQPASDATCGLNGAACAACVGTEESCGGGGEAGVCGCADDGTACGAAICGMATNNCGQTVTCGLLDGACPSGQECRNGTCICTPASCSDGCCDGDGVCQRETGAGACGTSGAACAACGENEICANGRCRFPVGTCPGVTNGQPCGDGGVCDNGYCFRAAPGCGACGPDVGTISAAALPGVQFCVPYGGYITDVDCATSADCAALGVGAFCGGPHPGNGRTTCTTGCPA